jgi:hypothetical protein
MLTYAAAGVHILVGTSQNHIFEALLPALTHAATVQSARLITQGHSAASFGDGAAKPSGGEVLKYS